MKKLNKFQLEEMNHHDKEAVFYAKRNEKDYIWEVPAKELLLFSQYIKQRSTVVDMGCGPAVLMKNIFPKELINSINYIGVDISKQMLKIAKMNIPRGRFIHDDMETIKIKKKSVDVIISLGALHHSQNKTKTLENWFSILKPKGLIIMREPTREALRKGHGESPNEEGVNVREIKEFIKKNNGELVRIEYFWSPFFHVINRFLIKSKLGVWRNSKKLWKVMLYVDIFVIRIVKYLEINFTGDSVAIVIEKNEDIN